MIGAKRLTSVALLVASGLVPVGVGEPPQYLPHDPILIVGNQGFTPQNGVVGGRGTPQDPFIIAGWDILGDGRYDGIEISFTDAYFVIEHNRIRQNPTTIAGDGIFVRNSINGRIVKNEITECVVGIFLVDSVVEVQRNYVGYNGRTFQGGGGILVSGPSLHYPPIRDNAIINNDPWGVFHGYNFLQPSDRMIPIDASRNYWGSAAPPLIAHDSGSAFIPPRGDPPFNNYVTMTVVVAPWLLEPPT